MSACEYLSTTNLHVNVKYPKLLKSYGKRKTAFPDTYLIRGKGSFLIQQGLSFLIQQGLTLFLTFAHIIFKIVPKTGTLTQSKTIQGLQNTDRNSKALRENYFFIWLLFSSSAGSGCHYNSVSPFLCLKKRVLLIMYDRIIKLVKQNCVNLCYLLINFTWTWNVP